MLKKRFITWLVIGSILVIILILLLPTMLESYVKYKLNSAEFTDTQITISHIGLSSAQIEKIRFSYISNQRRVELISHHINLDYSLTSLLFGQINNIDVKTANILIDKNTDSAQVVGELSEAHSLPNISDIPFKSFQLNKAIIIVRGETRDDIKLSASASAKNLSGQLTAQVNVERTNDSAIQANLEFLQDGRLHLNLSEGQQKELLLNFEANDIALNNDMLSTVIKANVDFQKLGRLLQSWGFASDASLLNGSITFDAKMQMPFDASLPFPDWLDRTQMEARMNMDVQVQKWAGIGQEIQAIVPLNVSIKAGTLDWNIGDKSMLKLVPDAGLLAGSENGLPFLTTADLQQTLVISLPKGLSGQSSKDSHFITDKQTSQQTIRIEYGKAEKLLRLGLVLQAPKLKTEPDWEVQSHLKYWLKLPDIKAPLLRTLKTSGGGALSLSKNTIKFTLDANSEITAASLKHDNMYAENLSATFLNSPLCQLNYVTQNWGCSPSTLKLNLTVFKKDDLAAKFKDARLKVLSLNNGKGALELKSQIEISGISLLAQDYNVKLDQFNVSADLVKSTLRGSIKLRTANNIVQLDADYQSNLQSRQGTLDYRLVNLDFSATSNLLRKIIISPALPIELHSGIAVAEGKLRWHPAKVTGDVEATGDLAIKLRDLGGRFQQNNFKGLHTDLVLTADKDKFVSKDALVSLASLQTGIDVTDIRFNIGGQSARHSKLKINVDNLSAKTLDGRLTGDKIHLDLDKESNPFVIQFHQLSLEKLLQLEQEQGLSGNGYIDGVLPFDYKPGQGLYMQQGHVYARAPGGLLQYKATEKVKSMAAGNPNIKLLLDALNNFNYNKLDADANYTPDGKLILNVKLQGKNPAFQKGRPVHFNVNVEENILQLMRSLQLGSEIGERLGDRVLKQSQ